MGSALGKLCCASLALFKITPPPKKKKKKKIAYANHICHYRSPVAPMGSMGHPQKQAKRS